MRNYLLLLFFFITCSAKAFKPGEPNSKVIIAYAGGFRGLMQVDSIRAEKITHLNYAFVDVRDNRAWLHNEATDTINLKNLQRLKQRNPALKIILSIGGWEWSRNFSDAALTDTSRITFAKSAAALVNRFNADGIDIDWEYPGLAGAGNIFRAADKENFTLLLQALRHELDSSAVFLGKPMLLTIAAGSGTYFLDHTEMQKVQQYLDYINLMTYDFSTEEDSVSGHHTNLFSSKNKNMQSSAVAVQNFMQAGVPANKIVVGIAFYGRGWKLKSLKHKGLFQPVLNETRSGGYTRLKDSIINQNGYKTYWDRKAKAPYLFNRKDSIFISYDNERSVKEKCNYVKQQQLAGVMFWEYFSDPKCYLLNVIDDRFNQAAGKVY